MSKTLIRCPDCGKLVTFRFPVHDCKPATQRKHKVLKFTRAGWPLADQPFHWHECYFLPGNKIDWMDFHTEQVQHGTVERVRVNRFGRISYYAAGHANQIQIEEVARAERKVPRGCVP